MLRIPEPKVLLRPIFTYLKPCGPCPSHHGTDPESEDILTCPDLSGIKDDFTCAWRMKGFCQGWAKKLGKRNRANGLESTHAQNKQDSARRAEA